MKNAIAVLSLFALLVATTGCYNTQVRTNATPTGVQEEERQWFTVGGLVGLSDSAGGECGEDGLAYSESRFAGTDILINIGLSLAGAGLGFTICDSDDEAEAFAACAQAPATLVPFLIGSRTVEYQCAGPAGNAETKIPPTVESSSL